MNVKEDEILLRLTPITIVDDGYRAVPRKFLGIVGQDPSDSKSSRLHVDIIFRFCFHSFGVYSSIDSSKLTSNSPEVSNFNRLVLKLNRSICNEPPVLPEPWYRVCYQVLLCS